MWSMTRNIFGINVVSFAPSGLVTRSAGDPRLAPWAAFFRRFAAYCIVGISPTAYAVGCTLSPLRGCRRALPAASVKRLPLRLLRQLFGSNLELGHQQVPG